MVVYAKGKWVAQEAQDGYDSQDGCTAETRQPERVD